MGDTRNGILSEACQPQSQWVHPASILFAHATYEWLKREKLDAACELWHNLTPAMQNGWDYAQLKETQCQHALETQDKHLLVVQDLERKLEVVEQWTCERPEWGVAAAMVGKCWYQRCLDSLKGLIVLRMFELTKVHLSQTGMCFIISFRWFNPIFQQATSFRNTLQRPCKHTLMPYMWHLTSTTLLHLPCPPHIPISPGMR